MTSRFKMKTRTALVEHRPHDRDPEQLLRRAENWLRAHYDLVCLKHQQPLIIRLSLRKDSCSDEMRNTLHMWFGEIADETGNDLEGVKDALVAEFVGTRRTTLPDGTVRETRLSTESIGHDRYLVLMDRVQAWAADWGVEITEPDPMMRERWRKAAERAAARRETEEQAA